MWSCEINQRARCRGVQPRHKFSGRGSQTILFHAQGFARDGKGFARHEYKIRPPRRRPLSHGSELRQGVLREPHCHRPVSAETGEDMESCDCKFHRLPISRGWCTQCSPSVGSEPKARSWCSNSSWKVSETVSWIPCGVSWNSSNWGEVALWGWRSTWNDRHRLGCTHWQGS